MSLHVDPAVSADSAVSAVSAVTAVTAATNALATAAAPVEQVRKLVTAIPGPASQLRHAQRKLVVSDGLGTVLPVFIERGGGGILVDVDGNHLIDLASGIAVTTVGASAPAVVRRVQEQVARLTHTCFLVTEYDGYVPVSYTHLTLPTSDLV